MNQGRTTTLGGLLSTRLVRYGRGSTMEEKVVPLEWAFPYASAVAPMPPLPVQPKDFFTAWGW